MIRLPDKELTILDKVVLDFIKFFDSDYVIVSGYVAILFGRSRNTEDVDLFITDNGQMQFTALYEKIMSSGKYYALNAEDAKDAYELMTVDKSSLRIAQKGTFNPNFEIKFARKDTDFYSMENAWLVELDRNPSIRISPMEIEIAYKLYLGSEKDLQDAAHLYALFKKLIDLDTLRDFIRKLGIKTSTAKKILGDDLYV